MKNHTNNQISFTNILLAIIAIAIVLGLIYFIIQTNQSPRNFNDISTEASRVGSGPLSNGVSLVERDSVLDIPLTQEGISSIEGWKITEMVGRGGRFMTPENWIVNEIFENEQVLWKIDKPEGSSRVDFIAAGNYAFSVEKYGEPSSCYGGDVENAICVYGDDQEILHLVKIMTWY